MNVLDPVKGLEAEIFASEENRRNGSVSGRCCKWIFGWKDIHQWIFADILWDVVQEDTNETFPDLRQKCRRHPRGLPLLGQFDSKWSKLLKLRKVFNHFYKIVLFPGSNLLLWENWMKMILLNLWKGKTKKWEILFGESSKSILSRCLRYSARLRRSQRRRRT